MQASSSGNRRMNSMSDSSESDDFARIGLSLSTWGIVIRRFEDSIGVGLLFDIPNVGTEVVYIRVKDRQAFLKRLDRLGKLPDRLKHRVGVVGVNVDSRIDHEVIIHKRDKRERDHSAGVANDARCSDPPAGTVRP